LRERKTKKHLVRYNKKNERTGLYIIDIIASGKKGNRRTTTRRSRVIEFIKLSADIRRLRPVRVGDERDSAAHGYIILCDGENGGARYYNTRAPDFFLVFFQPRVIIYMRRVCFLSTPHVRLARET